MHEPGKQEDVQQQLPMTQSEEGTLPDLSPLQDQGFDRSQESWLKKILQGPVLGNELGWLGSYKVLKILGRGGMGVVFQAEDSHLQRLVALKVMLPDLADQAKARERFLREARAVAALRNDHVVTIYQVGQEGDTPYLAMEFLHGRNLDECLDSGQQFTPWEIVRIGREVAQGLAAAHAAGLIHRDIKPANIWLDAPATGHEQYPPKYRIKILDFGLARPVQQSSGLTKTGNIVGTPHYMSPEQARAKTVDARSDLFSLGTVLYHLCTNQLPFQGDTLMALLTSLAVDLPRPIRDLNPAVPQELADLITRMLAKDPAQRPASALEVVEILTHIEGCCPQSDSTRQSQNFCQPAQARKGGSGRGGLSGSFLGGRFTWVLAGLATIFFLGGVFWIYGFSFLGGAPVPPGPSGPPLLIGVLHSKTGTFAISERPVIDAVLLAVEELNQQGGVLGRPVQAIVEDGESDDEVFARQAEKLITQDKVATIFGCWSSHSRKAVKEVVEKHNHLLIYATAYEGMELSPNIIYGGAVPNQQILPSLRWCYGFLQKKRWFLVGTESVFPRAAHEVIKDEAKTLGSKIVGEEYIFLGQSTPTKLVQKIKDVQPDLILNTLKGDSNVFFFRVLRAAGIHAAEVPTLSFCISETELVGLKTQEYAGDYFAASYLQGIDRPQNKEFLHRFRARYGEDRQVSDSMQTSYYSVFLWAQAAKRAGSVEPAALRDAHKGLRLEAPQGLVEIDAATQHTIQQARIGKFLHDGSVEEVFLTPQPIRPEPYPLSRTRAQWDAHLHQLYLGWGGRWSKAE